VRSRWLCHIEGRLNALRFRRRSWALVFVVAGCDGGCGAKESSAGAVTPEPAGEVAIQPGRFSMGSPRGEPCRDEDEEQAVVTVTRAFALSSREVTQSEFDKLMGYNPSFRKNCSDCPVDSVTHDEAEAYCNKLSESLALEGCYTCTGTEAATQCEAKPDSLLDCKGHRLPTETEWELAARAGTKTATAAGRINACMSDDEVADRISWYKVSSKGESQPVATKAANRLGLHDMAGNVYEWTADWYAPSLQPGTDPVGPPTGAERVLRGGSWYHNAEHLRSGNRHAFRPNKRLSYVGFRCARTIDETTPSSP
jgi:formylglycine-generating enzyme required for sulfatase activity